MKPYFTLLYTILVILLSAGCNMPLGQGSAPVSDTVMAGSDSTVTTTPAGRWYNDENIYGCMSLEISDSGKFIFSEESSAMSRYSEGTCRRNGNHIRLTSFDRYKNGTAPTRTGFHPGDTAFIYLNDEQYLLQKDTLFKLDATGSRTDAEFHRQ